ncbi:Ig-like domain-containing protein [Nocardioides speluncae]|uniref:Ig-like domain-containing protein n=1 Tax=Nocardioides speluncae TaxID=2670337 RepID=UPI000D68DC6C|nr:Ig-like domain-containing protein [Nocardioides speluncae]
MSIAAALIAALLAATALAAPSGTAAAAAPPTCDLTSPAPSSTVSGMIDLDALFTYGDDSVKGAEFFVDGKSVGFGFLAGWAWKYTRPGTKPVIQNPQPPFGTGTNLNGFTSHHLSNASHTFSCRYFGPSGVGAMSPTRTLTVSNPRRSGWVSPADGTVLNATASAPRVTLQASYSGFGTARPTATFYVEGQAVSAATTCQTATRCTFAWDPRASQAEYGDDKAQSGLRVVRAKVVNSSGQTTWTQPVKLFLNQSDTGSTLLLSKHEAAGLGRVVRDGGWSRQIPGTTQSFFIFGDTAGVVTTGAPDDDAWRPHLGDPITRFHSTFGTTPVRTGAPGPIEELPNPDGHPAAMPGFTEIKVPQSMLSNPDGTACEHPDGSPAGLTWATGVIGHPQQSGTLLVSYNALCLGDPNNWQRQVEGIAELDPSTGAVLAMHNLWTAAAGAELAPGTSLSSPVVKDGTIYFYRTDTSGTFEAHVATDSWANPGAYEFNPVPIAAGSSGPHISVDRYTKMPGSPYLKVTAPTWNTLTIEHSSTPTGPWRPTNVTDLRICSHCDNGLFYAAYGHPEFSSSSSMLLTYVDSFVATGRYRILSKMMSVGLL